MTQLTNFQKYLEANKAMASENWRHELTNLDMTGDFDVADAKSFLDSVTKSSVASWAVNTELTTRHQALKKIIDSI